MVYVNYGRSEDINVLKQSNIETKGNIFIARLRHDVFPGDVVMILNKKTTLLYKVVLMYVFILAFRIS